VTAPHDLDTYWALEPSEVARRLESGLEGLTSAQASVRLKQYGPNELREHQTLSRLRTLTKQVQSPLLLLLVFAAAASLATGAWLDALIVLTIVLATVAIGFSREYRAQIAVAALRSRIRTRAHVIRDGRETDVYLREIVPGDILLLSAGSLVPADAILLEATDLFVSESVLTGESFPVQKRVTDVASDAGLADRTNCLFLGTNVRSGMGRALVVQTGNATAFGAIAKRLNLEPPETEFDRGIKRFGYLLVTTMLVMSVVVFSGNMIAHRPPVETVLFAIALAVGLSPELLPAILNVNLTRAAQSMAARGVLVRRLSAIENLGSIDVLCTDKTGTLTEGLIQLEGAYDPHGQPSSEVLKIAGWNAALETGIKSPLDHAILAAVSPNLASVTKVGEAPFDFTRKRVTVAVKTDTGIRLITKGTFDTVLDVCAQTDEGAALTEARRSQLNDLFAKWSVDGIRVLGVAVRDVDSLSSDVRPLERAMTLVGFLTFLDQPKAGVGDAIAALTTLGIDIKVITGDNRHVARHIADLVGLRSANILTGRDLDSLNDEALWHVADRTNLFVEVDPNQKVRIISSLRRMGHVVGFLGDGVNDAPAMHAADTSLSVDDAVDVARETADFVLLEHSLDVICRGVMEGRRTFANTMKYILITTSANLGNMISMAIASLWLPFLPLLAGQILLNNFLSDIPAIGLADDAVDPELIDRPRRWDVRFIGRFMVAFGLLSTTFDLITFAVLRIGFDAGPELFRTAWFVESLLTELLIALVVRTQRPFFRSRPGTVLLVLTLTMVPMTLALPYVHALGGVLGFVSLPVAVVAAVIGVTASYVVATEGLKRRFYALVRN
jgi:P-type Mg2+ transporter